MPAAFLPYRWYLDAEGLRHAYQAYRGLASPDVKWWPICAGNTLLIGHDRHGPYCTVCLERVSLDEPMTYYEEVA